MRIPKYQWLMPEPNPTCGFCDEVAIHSDFTPKFQLVSDTIGDDIINEQFAANPFDLITSDDLGFKLTYPIEKQLQFYFAGKTFIITWAIQPGTYTYSVSGDVYYINVTVDVSTTISDANFAVAMADIVDPIAGTTTSLDIPTAVITMFNIPADSYLNNSYGFINTISTVTASGVIGKSFYWTGTGICYFKTYIGDIEYQFLPVSLTAGKEYKFSFDYTSDYLDFDIDLVVYDGTTTTTIPLTYNSTDGTIAGYYTGLLTASTTFKLILTDSEAHNSGFCFDNVVLAQIQMVDNIESVDCNGTVTDIDYEETISESNTLIEITGTLPDIFQLQITDNEGNVTKSRWYEVTEGDNCADYIKLNWTSDCAFGEIDYTNLPFENELLLTGVLIMQSLEDLDSEDNITADGRKISIYQNTQERYELRLHPYLMSTQQVLQRVFQHSTININDELYNATEPYQTSEIDNGVYTGTVDLFKDGTQVITSKCCC